MNLPNHDISAFDESFVTATVQKRSVECGCASPQQYHDRLQSDPLEESAFFASLHISYSEFFRDPLTFAVLEKIVIPGLVLRAGEKGRREIRIWSAGCAAGQEAYSVAILIAEALEKSRQPVDYRIFATDACEAQTQIAGAGMFDAESLGNICMKRLDRWFLRQGGEYAVVPQLREHIEFSVFDLLESATDSPPASIFGDFDLVLCCNLLFYYTPVKRQVILGSVTRCIAPHGCLVTGETERGFVIGNGWKEAVAQSSIFEKPQYSTELMK